MFSDFQYFNLQPEPNPQLKESKSCFNAIMKNNLQLSNMITSNMIFMFCPEEGTNLYSLMFKYICVYV